LHTATIYGFLIAGVFILPDAPLNAFWLGALWLYISAFDSENRSRGGKYFITAGILTALALMSKYTAVYLWAGIWIYILLWDRKWLKLKELYIGQVVTAAGLLPTLIWNIQNGFVSFTFHSERVTPTEGIFNLTNLLTEIGGEALYINPLIIILIYVAIFLFLKKGIAGSKRSVLLLFTVSLPLIFTFLVVSIFRPTLPHWNSIGYMSLLPLVAIIILEKLVKSSKKLIIWSLTIQLVILCISTIQTLTGVLPINRILGTDIKNNADPTLEIFGWKQLSDGFEKIASDYEKRSETKSQLPVITYRWFPAANYSYYVGRNTGRPVLALGDTIQIHNYAWINSKQYDLRINSDAWYITSDLDFRHPLSNKDFYYEKISKPDTLSILRLGKPAYNFYIYRLQNLQAKR
jgi:4-amino-4-deoxy-L-arabinose transferase-like glycosyltransferase